MKRSPAMNFENQNNQEEKQTPKPIPIISNDTIQSRLDEDYDEKARIKAELEEDVSSESLELIDKDGNWNDHNMAVMATGYVCELKEELDKLQIENIGLIKDNKALKAQNEKLQQDIEHEIKEVKELTSRVKQVETELKFVKDRYVKGNSCLLLSLRPVEINIKLQVKFTAYSTNENLIHWVTWFNDFEPLTLLMTLNNKWFNATYLATSHNTQIGCIKAIVDRIATDFNISTEVLKPKFDFKEFPSTTWYHVCLFPFVCKNVFNEFSWKFNKICSVLGYFELDDLVEDEAYLEDFLERFIEHDEMKTTQK